MYLLQLKKELKDKGFDVKVGKPTEIDNRFQILHLGGDLDELQAVLDEIDGMPDMHLAKFLKGQDDYKLIPIHPKMSDTFKNWIIEITEQYPYPDFQNQI